MLIGITGTIGAGKSKVTSYLSEKGYSVFDADKMTHGYYEKEGALYEWLIDHFGKQILDEEGNINRRILGDILFLDRDALNRVEIEVFNLVKHEINGIKQTNTDANMIFVEVPLLFEAHLETLFDLVVVVDAETSIRYQRLKDKGLSDATINAREQRQFSSEKKRSLGQFTLWNNDTIDTLYKKIDLLIERMED